MAKTTHVIVEVDRDYRTVTDTTFMDFASEEAAKDYASKKTWTGYQYYAYAWEEYFS